MSDDHVTIELPEKPHIKVRFMDEDRDIHLGPVRMVADIEAGVLRFEVDMDGLDVLAWQTLIRQALQGAP